MATRDSSKDGCHERVADSRFALGPLCGTNRIVADRFAALGVLLVGETPSCFYQVVYFWHPLFYER